MTHGGCGGGSQADAAAAHVKDVKDALELFHIKYGRYPAAAEGLGLLLQPPQGKRPMLGRLPIDPWGQSLVYRAPTPTSRFELYSRGPDGLAYTEDDIGRCSVAWPNETGCPQPVSK